MSEARNFSEFPLPTLLEREAEADNWQEWKALFLKYEIELATAHKELLPLVSEEARRAIRMSALRYRQIGRCLVLDCWEGASILCTQPFEQKVIWEEQELNQGTSDGFLWWFDVNDYLT